MNLAGLGAIYNNNSTLNQQSFQLLAVPGSLTLVSLNGVVQNPDTYTIAGSVLTFDNPLPSGVWVYVLSGQGGTFIPQSYVDDVADQKANIEDVNSALNTKANRSGTTFTGPVTILEPTQAMHPVTKQMFDSLPEIATPDYIDAALANKISQGTFDAAIDDLIPLDEKGMPNGVVETDGSGLAKISQLPLVSLYDKEDINLLGALTIGRSVQSWAKQYGGVINALRVRLTTPADGSALRLNILRNGVAVFEEANWLTVPEDQSSIVITFNSSITYSAGQTLGIRVEAVGSSTAGSDLYARLELASIPN